MEQDTNREHRTVAVVLQVREDRLQPILWRLGRGRWALPGGLLAAEELEHSIRRHLDEKVDVRELSHLEQLETRADAHTGPVTTAYLGLVRLGIAPAVPEDTRWHPVDELPPTAFDHGSYVLAGRDRLRAQLSYTKLGFALAPQTVTVSGLRDVSAAALGYDVSATTLQRVLLRREVLEPTGERRPSGRAGGR